MAYDLAQVNGYGTGTLGDVTDPTGQLCSYANVASVTEVAVATNALTINAPSLGAYEKFEVGTEILLHVSGCLSGTTAGHLGKYIVCKITGVQTSTLSSADKILIIDKKITDVLPVEQFAAHILQVVTIPQFKTLTVTGTISPIAYNIANKYGGILPIKCLIGLVMSGSGKINLVDMGIPVANKALRYWTLQECATYNLAVTATTTSNGLLDTDKYSCWENHITVRQMLLNAGDGVCAIWAQKITNTEASANTRIGGTAGGVQFCRGANDSKGYNEAKPGNATNIGGSTIMLVADDMDGFAPSMIAKYRDSTKTLGQGLGRCYIASNTKLRNDEGLYTYDCIANPYRLMRTLNIKNYGDGSLGDITNPTVPLNNYAKVTSISADGKTLSYTNKTATGLAPIATGALIMFHVSKGSGNLLGKFILAKVLSDDGNNLIIDTPVTNVFAAGNFGSYNCQIVSVAQVNNLTISVNYSATTAWNDTNKIGGICAITSKGKCDISNGQINVEGKGGGTAYGRNGLAFIGNAQMADILPLGQGHGSVFLLAKDGSMNTNSRIGATYSGAEMGGIGTYTTSQHYAELSALSRGYQGSFKGYASAHGEGGSGADGGIYMSSPYVCGGYGSNGVCLQEAYGIGYGINGSKGLQGAHCFLVFDKLNLFDIQCVSTGGAGAIFVKAGTDSCPSGNGGSGYGGGGEDGGYGGGSGGYNGGGGPSYYYGGGSSGWAFIYANTVITENTAGVVAA